MIRCILLGAVLCSAVQEPSKPTREDLVKELEAKFHARGPLQVDFTLTAKAPDAEPDPRGSGSFYWDLERRNLFVRFITRKDGKAEPERFMWGDVNILKMWGGGEKAQTLDWGRHFGDLITTINASQDRLDKILGRPPQPALDMFGGKPILIWTLEADPDGEEASLRISLGSATKTRSVSWFKEIEDEPEGAFRILDAGIEFELKKCRKTLVVDRNTGCLKSIRLQLKNGEWRTMEASAARAVADRPKPAFPDRFSVPILGIDGVKERLKMGYYTISQWTVEGILVSLDREGIGRKAEDLRSYYRDLMKSFARSVAEAGLAVLADRYVAQLEGKGVTFEEMEKRIDKMAQVYDGAVKEAEKERADLVAWMVGKSRDALGECLKESPKGSAEAKAELEKIFDDVFKDPEGKTYLPSLPDAKAMILKAIQRAKDAK